MNTRKITRPVTQTLKRTLSRKYQDGMSSWAWLIFLMLLAAAGTAVLKLGPHYIDWRVVQSVADRLPQDVHQKMTRGDINEHFAKQFRVESFRIPVHQMMEIKRDPEQTVIHLSYKVREHLFYNVDVVLVFNESRTFK